MSGYVADPPESIEPNRLSCNYPILIVQLRLRVNLNCRSVPTGAYSDFISPVGRMRAIATPDFFAWDIPLAARSDKKGFAVYCRSTAAAKAIEDLMITWSGATYSRSCATTSVSDYFLQVITPIPYHTIGTNLLFNTISYVFLDTLTSNCYW
jgi:hypothetical protein